MNISPFDFQLQFTFANDAMAELDRKLALLYSTREGTMPLDREFGINMDFVDMPPEVAKSFTRRRSPKRRPNLSRRCGCSPSNGPMAARAYFIPRW